jgi:multicomponent Na+:H+ antiporter subunit D
MVSSLILLPILIPFTGALVAILFRKKYAFQRYWSFGGMLTSMVVSAYLLFTSWSTETTYVYSVGGWPPPFGITLVGDLFGLTFTFMSQLVFCSGLLYAIGAKDKCVRFPLFFPLFLLLATGLTGSLLTGDLFNLFVFTELLVISGAVLTAISDDKFGVEAAFKYFYISLLASAFLLLAIGILYISYGTLNMADLAARIQAHPDRELLPIGIAFLLATFMIKSAAFPFHFWQPDFHTASPTAVSALLSSVIVKLGIYGFIRMTTLLFQEQAVVIQTILIISGLLGIFYGGLGAIGTYNVKRMLAYSTIGQLGFILIAIGIGTPLGYTAAIVFSFNHSLIKAAMLMLAGSLASRHELKSAAFAEITGLGKYLPLTGILFFLGSLGLAGIPPTNGFISKFLVFRGAVDSSFYIPVALIGIGSILTLIYTMRAFQKIWWQSGDPAIIPKPDGDRLFAPVILITFVVLLGIFAEPLIEIATEASAFLLNPDIYISAVFGGS